jgi:tRNA 5-methylaminomethyl-2-thiouridine biosynthesis bifunctional protein
MPRTAEEETAQRAALETLGYPSGYARWLTRAEASKAAGTQVAEGGLWFEHGGWVRPPSLVAALLAKAKVSIHFGIEAASMARTTSGWAALDGAGKTIAEAPVVVLANAHDAMRLAPLGHTTLRSVRGQVSYLPAGGLPTLRAVLLRGGMALPPVDGIVVAGASYDPGDRDPAPRADSHAGNLARIAKILSDPGTAFDPATLSGRVGFRAVAHDRLPIVGSHPHMAGVHGAFAYASRGILWCTLMAELLASQLESEPLPLQARLADAVAPARFMRRAGRRKG